MWGRVEEPDAARERLLNSRNLRFFIKQLKKVAHRGGSQPDDGERQILAVPSLYASRFHVASQKRCGCHLFKYFVASRLATPVSFRPWSFRNRLTRSGSRFDSSRSHQPTAF